MYRGGIVISQADGGLCPNSGAIGGQTHRWWSAFRGQRESCAGRRPATSERAGNDQTGEPVIGEDETRQLATHRERRTDDVEDRDPGRGI